jgi:hypothetical protein
MKWDVTVNPAAPLTLRSRVRLAKTELDPNQLSFFELGAELKI